MIRRCTGVVGGRGVLLWGDVTLWPLTYDPWCVDWLFSLSLTSKFMKLPIGYLYLSIEGSGTPLWIEQTTSFKNRSDTECWAHVLFVSQVDFLALEMRQGKVNFLWDVGSGVGRVEYPHHTLHDGNWHRIEASRWDRHTHTQYMLMMCTSVSYTTTVEHIRISRSHSGKYYLFFIIFMPWHWSSISNIKKD